MQVIVAACCVVRRRAALWMLCCAVLLSGVALGEENSPSPPSNGKEKPLALDLSKSFYEPITSSTAYKDFAGRRIIDGLPFHIEGRIRLYGEMLAKSGHVHPFSAKRIRIDRKFDELHLIHYTSWPDVEGQTVAYVHLNYADDTDYIFPIRYGVHVRDILNLPSYEKEAVTDPNTTICWRLVVADFKSPARLFKSKFLNPSPEKVVTTVDFVSARSLASFHLVAATVATKAAAKTPHRSAVVPAAAQDRHFDGHMVVRVLDDATGKPIEGALVLVTGMDILDVGVIGSPFNTSPAGEGTISYPVQDTTSIFASVRKEGYRAESHSWQEPFPETFTFRLKRADK